MSKVSRRVIYEGEYFTIECAVRSDGSSPAKDMLDFLASGLVEIPGFPPPDDMQVLLLEDFIMFMKDIGEGYRPRAGALNYLRDGIWELKRDSVRITFFDADGHGGSHG